jgi:hypothetical protein
MPRPTLVLLLSSIFLLHALPSEAQPPPGPPEHVERRSSELEGGAMARLVTRWTADAIASGASLTLGDAAPTLLVRGASAAAIERGEHVAVVAYEAFDGGPPFCLRVIRREAGRDVLSEERGFARPGSRTGDVPFAVAIAPIPGRGFAVFFEEVQGDDPSGARTYLFHLDLEGQPMDAGVEIPVPWPIAAAAWNGHGFHLALLYPGGTGGMRLSMVSLSPEGMNQQHPDWSSAPGFVADVHLVVLGDHVHAHYRGGRGGEHWLETDVTAIAGWGTDTRHATDHGRLEPDTTLSVDAEGRVGRVSARDDGIAAH